MSKLFLIEEEVGNALLEYLANQPYREVYALMAALQGLSEYMKPDYQQIQQRNDYLVSKGLWDEFLKWSETYDPAKIDHYIPGFQEDMGA